MNWTNAAPEIFYFAAGLWFLLISFKTPADVVETRSTGLEEQPSTRIITQTVGPVWSPLIIAALGIIVCLVSCSRHGWLFIRSYQVDIFSQVFKVLISVGLFLIVCISGGMTDLQARRISRGRRSRAGLSASPAEGAVNPLEGGNPVPPSTGSTTLRTKGWGQVRYSTLHHEYYFLLLTCTLALMLLVSAVHLLSIYVSLEVSSYSLYILVALRKDQRLGLEAGIKYFLIGTFASAVMLFGMALLYATSGTAYLADISGTLPQIIGRPGVVIGLLFALGGFFFKLAIFPFHFWAPDTYQGAANQVAAYIATASKVAGIAVLLRVAAFAGQGSAFFVHVLVVLSVVSMTLGNLAAIVQKDFKRLLAFSTTAHSGYVLIGILVLSPAGYSGAIFYAVALLLMKFTAFMVIVELAADGRNLQIEELAGLHRRSPIMAMALLVSLFSLAGIPPTVGFTGKFLLFVAAIQKGYVALVIIAMINVVISLYYYLLAIKAAYLLEPAEALPPLMVSFPRKLLAGLSTAVIVLAGFCPYWLIQLAQTAARTLVWRP